MGISVSKISFIMLLVLVIFPLRADLTFPVVSITLKQTHFIFEIADTNERQRQGLMYRKSLAENAGMLFVYSTLGDHRIWMKNTLIPLTVIWLDQQARVVDVKLLKPCQQKNCPAYAAAADSKYIIELHSSQFQQFQVNDRLPELLEFSGRLPALLEFKPDN